MKRLLAVVSIIIACISGCAPSGNVEESPHDTFYEAARAYQNGAYDKAIKLYEGIRAEGLENGVLYYNLGNSYLKQNEIGRAILNYTRARHYIPRDNELIANYSYAIARMKQPDPGPRASLFTQDLMRLFSMCTIKETSGIFFLGYYLFTSLILYMIFVRKRRIIAVTLAFMLAVSTGLAALPLFDKMYEAERGAITISSVIDAKREPYDDSPTSFPLYGGMKCYITKERVGWVKVQRPDGRIGWVPVLGIEKIRQ